MGLDGPETSMYTFVLFLKFEVCVNLHVDGYWVGALLISARNFSHMLGHLNTLVSS